MLLSGHCSRTDGRSKPTLHDIQGPELVIAKQPLAPDIGRAAAWHRCTQLPHVLRRRHHQVRGAVAPGRLQLQHDLSGGVALHPVVGQRRPGDPAAKLLQRAAVVGVDTIRRERRGPGARRSILQGTL